MKLLFYRMKYCWRKRDERVAVHCSLFAVNFRARRFFFSAKKILCVCRRDRYPDANPAYSVRQKTCSQNMANAFYTLFAVHRFFVISPLFCCCAQIVYRLKVLIYKVHPVGLPIVVIQYSDLFEFWSLSGNV